MTFPREKYGPCFVHKSKVHTPNKTIDSALDVIVEYYDAKKDRICPLIEFVDDEDKS